MHHSVILFKHVGGIDCCEQYEDSIKASLQEGGKNKLEFLVPWWDFQLGISVNQFLSIFGSSDSDFRLVFFLGKSC